MDVEAQHFCMSAFLDRFFTEQNNRIFQTLIDVSQSQDRQLTSEHMKMMGLDPSGDRAFLMELVEVYGIDVMLIVDNPCCPTWQHRKSSTEEPFCDHQHCKFYQQSKSVNQDCLLVSRGFLVYNISLGRRVDFTA
jgi:hypothetical protein